MKAIALAIAMAGLAMAAKAAIVPATAAAAPTVQCAAKVAEAAETAAVVAVLPEANVTAKAEPSVGKIDAVGESDAAKVEPNVGTVDAVGKADAAKVEPNVGTVDAVGESDASKANQPVVLTEAREESKTVAGSVGEVQPAKDGDTCSLVGMYSRCRLLSGPWSVKRRLEAARIRGDTEEEERMKTLLDELVDAAIEVEEEDP